MAEADLIAFLIPLVVSVYLAVLLYVLHKQKKQKEHADSKVPTFNNIPYYTPEEKKNFVKGIPIGLSLGIIIYIQHLNAMFGGEYQWWFPFIQADPVVLFVTLLFLYSGFKFLAALTNLPIFKKKHGLPDGIFSSFVVIQIIVFLKFPLIFFPILPPP